MSFDYPVRAKATIVLLLALTLLSGIYGILKEEVFDFVPHYEVTEYQKRFDGLKQVLPRRGAVGYLGDSQNDRRLSRMRYRFTQYALAPLVIANTAGLPLVVGDFHDKDSNRSLLQANGLTALSDGGNGVGLFRGREDALSGKSRVPFATLRSGGDRDQKSERPDAPRQAQAGSSLLGLLSLALSILIGFLFTSCLLTAPGAPPSFQLIKLFVSVGIGLGISSCLTFFWLLAGGLNWARLLAVEFSLLAVLAVLSFQQWKRQNETDRQEAPLKSVPAPGLQRFIVICFLLAAALSVTVFAALAVTSPHGGHDAFAIWNLRAKFLFKGGEFWADAFSRHIGWSNLGYPLLIPASVARGWIFSGFDSVAIPITIALLFTAGAVGLAASALSLTRSTSQGLLAGTVLLGTPFFIRLGAWQVADLPLAFFFLASLVLLSLSKRFQTLQHRMVFLAGLCAGFSAWTKNEGLLFLVATLLSLLIPAFIYRQDRTHRKNIAFYVLGALPLLLMVWYFKTQIVPDSVSATSNPIASPIASDGPAGPGLWSRLIDFTRHFAVLKAYQGEIRDLGRGPFSMPMILAFYLLVFGTITKLKLKSEALTGLATVLLMFGGYYLVYILAPVDLTFHSLDRVMMQVWPSALFVYFLIVRAPEEAFAIRETEAPA